MPVLLLVSYIQYSLTSGSEGVHLKVTVSPFKTLIKELDTCREGAIYVNTTNHVIQR